MDYLKKAKTDVQSDYTWNRLGRLGAKGARALPSASAQYAVDKVPIVQWLPRYNYRWIVNDAIAGLTLGLMLIPQSLSYAQIATIPVQYGLMSSWIPAAFYAFMGTTKDVSTGPTSLIGLITSEGVAAFKDQYSPSEIASAMALMMGVYGMVVGFLKLGFLLEFISLPILSGFISAVAITIMLNQMDSLLGEDGVRDGTAQQIHDVLAKLPSASGYTCAIGFTGIALLVILEQSGKRWGHKNRIIWLASISRAFLTLVLFTGISYAVNKNRSPDNYLWEVAQVQANGIQTPRMPDSTLISKVASRSVALFIGMAVEHTGIARAFGVRNNYVPDQSQELAYLGVTNFVNSFFHSMGVGGAMSRTSVNSASKVKSPLSGLITTAFVLIAIFELTGTLYWIPKATLSAIVITAVWPLIHSPATFYKYWKTSLADFTSSMIAFWISLFVSTEYGIAASVGFNIVYVVLRQTFAQLTAIGVNTPSELAISIDDSQGMPRSVPADVRLFRFNESFFFPNSYRLKTNIIDGIQTFHSPAYDSAHGTEAERNWSVVAEKRLARLRRKENIRDQSTLPPLRLAILDCAKVNHIDATAVSHLNQLFNEVTKYAGKDAEIRFVSLSEEVKTRFRRAGWILVDVGAGEDAWTDNPKTIKMFRTVADAISAPTAEQESDGDTQREKEIALQKENMRVSYNRDEIA